MPEDEQSRVRDALAALIEEITTPDLSMHDVWAISCLLLRWRIGRDIELMMSLEHVREEQRRITRVVLPAPRRGENMPPVRPSAATLHSTRSTSRNTRPRRKRQ